jgi:sugar phosphate isomerase/epimerase
MQTISRRRFLGAGATGIAAGCLSSGALELRADPLGLPIGFQAFTVRDQIGKDFEGTLRQIAAMGYQTVEMCSPQGYRGGFATLSKLKASEIRQTIQAAGLRCVSCHYGFKELKASLDERIAYAKELGLSQMILSTFGVKEDATWADWARSADELNKIGEQTGKAGIQLGFHNHNFEFKEIDGVLIYDRLMSAFDPKLIKMQFQVAVISLGFEAATFLKKYPGRFLSLHLADWSTSEKKPVAVGAGVVDWPRLFAAAKSAGIKNYFVEVNPEALKASYSYLHDLKV